MKKYYLLAPGPTPMPPRVLQAMTRPILHHRTKEFVALMKSVSEDLRWLFETTSDVLILNSTGTGGMEASVTNFLSRGDKAIAVCGGKFGKRWSQIGKAFGVEMIDVNVANGEAVDPQTIAKLLDEHPDVRAVFTQGSETSTGVAHPVKEIAALVRNRPETLMVVDGVTSVGVMPQPMDEWGIDVLVSGSQKAFMLPPGLAFVGVSSKAWSFAERSNLPKYYFNLSKERKTQGNGESAYTSAVSLVMGLRESLNMMKEEGLAAIFRRHALLAQATREGLMALGCELLAKTHPSAAVTAVYPPNGVAAGDVTSTLSKKYNITAAGGQDELKGKIFRIAHLGYAGRFDVITAISALEMVFKELGYKFDSGIGVATAHRVLEEGGDL